MNRSADENGNWFHLVGKIVDPLDSKNRLEPTPNDVLLGRGKGKQLHIGNVNFLRKIDESLDLYHQQRRGHKKQIVMMIIEWVRNRKGSFLKETFEGNWIEADESAAKEKVSQAFRHRKLRLKASNPNAAATEKANGLLADPNVDEAPIADESDYTETTIDGVSREQDIEETKASPIRILPGRETSADLTAKARRRTGPSPSELIGTSQQKVGSGITHSFSLFAAHAVKAYPTDINLQPFARIDDGNVDNKLPSELPSQPENISAPNKSPSRDDDAKKPTSSSHRPQSSRPECQSVRFLSDELVSDSEIFDAIKAWDV